MISSINRKKSIKTYVEKVCDSKKKLCHPLHRQVFFSFFLLYLLFLLCSHLSILWSFSFYDVFTFLHNSKILSMDFDKATYFPLRWADILPHSMVCTYDLIKFLLMIIYNDSNTLQCITIHNILQFIYLFVFIYLFLY